MKKIFKPIPKTGKLAGLANPKGKFTILFFVVGFLSLIWFLIRVIPKPSRATYPCMKATMPIAASFITYIISLTASLVVIRKVSSMLAQRKYIYLLASLLLVGITLTFAVLSNSSVAVSNDVAVQLFDDPLGPNTPIGEAKGIFPGRVVWAWNPDATNENCTNSSHNDAYWLTKNTDQSIVDQMLSEGLLAITGEASDSEAWDAIFKYFNVNHGKGDVGYLGTETIFIKINGVTAWSGADPDGEMPPEIPIEFDTSPQTIMAMLRQLVNNAGVPQEKIFIGDPLADMWNNLYDYFHEEFPDINYCSRRTVSGRYKLIPSSLTGITYSDKGSVMDQVTTHKFYKEMMDSDYLLNIPTMKGHRWGGITLFAKNHFGSNTTDGSWQLHKGLMNPDNAGMRYGYKLYRVFVDLIGSKYLGGNTLLYYIDGLWSTSYEHQKPQKFRSTPFKDDWSSSILLSFDPVAIESVCLDILQKEFKVEEIENANDDLPDRFIYVQWDGVDDYLHQAASSDWWPDGISYDPDNSGTAIESLGVHEHWNNESDMDYSRNLETGEGIELIKNFYGENSIVEDFILSSKIEMYPNPCVDKTYLILDLPQISSVSLVLYDSDGKCVKTESRSSLPVGPAQIEIVMSGLPSGNYFLTLQLCNSSGNSTISKRIIKK